jgi:hypothetical protein
MICEAVWQGHQKYLPDDLLKKTQKGSYPSSGWLLRMWQHQTQ